MSRDGNNVKAAKKGGLLSRLLLIFGILLLAAAVGIAGYVVWNYLDAQNRYHDIQSVAGLEIDSPEVVDADLQLADLNFDWDALREINPDVVGWIIIPGTSINYPVVQGYDNEIYLHMLFDQTYSSSGAIFADYEGSPTLDGLNNIVFGHNMLDRSMFSDIIMYLGQDFFDEHRTVFLCTPEMNFELSAIATVNIPMYTYLRQWEFISDEELDEFIYEQIGEPDTYASDMDDLIASTYNVYWFVTCDNFDASRRITLCCVPVNSVVPSNAAEAPAETEE